MSMPQRIFVLVLLAAFGAMSGIAIDRRDATYLLLFGVLSAAVAVCIIIDFHDLQRRWYDAEMQLYKKVWGPQASEKDQKTVAGEKP